ncbi:hypothetical protein D3C87_1368710 [compost metagenome]
MPTLTVQKLSKHFLEELSPIGWKIGFGEPNQIIFYPPNDVAFQNEDQMQVFVYGYIDHHKLEMLEKTEFHFYQGGKWVGGIIFEPK